MHTLWSLHCIMNTRRELLKHLGQLRLRMQTQYTQTFATRMQTQYTFTHMHKQFYYLLFFLVIINIIIIRDSYCCC